MHCPVVNVRNQNESARSRAKKNGWFTPELAVMKTWLLCLYDRWKITSNMDDKIRFNNFKKRYNLAIRQAKICANDKAIIESSNRCKAAWRVIRAETGQTKMNADIPVSPDTLNRCFVDATDANLVLDSGTSHNDLLGNFPLNNRCTNDRVFRWREVSVQTVSAVVKGLSNSRSEDVYGLSNYTVKKLLLIFALPLTYLINFMMGTGTFPECLKSIKNRVAHITIVL